MRLHPRAPDFRSALYKSEFYLLTYLLTKLSSAMVIWVHRAGGLVLEYRTRNFHVAWVTWVMVTRDPCDPARFVGPFDP